MMRNVHVAAVSLWISAGAYAHQPIFGTENETTPNQAIQVGDVDLSQVLYTEITSAAPRAWLTFEGSQGYQLSLRLGVPMIDRLSSYRPAMAIVGPGLPAVQLPFEMPAGLGGVIYESADQPESFHEPFTGTDSWIMRDATVTLPQDGRYYLVAWDPAGEPGKLWVAFGKREEFSLDDLTEFGNIISQVRAFHEVNGQTLPCFLLPAAAVAVPLVGWRLSRAARSRRDRLSPPRNLRI